VLSAVVVLLLVLVLADPASAKTSPTTTAPPPTAKAWILVDGDTGNILDAGNPRTPLPPASLTKVLTAITAINNLPATATIPVSARAEAAPPDKMFMKQGQVWTFDQLIHCLLLASANDAAIALAEGAGGSVEGFQSMFAATAASLGLADQPVLKDPAGLDGSSGVDGGNLISPRDLAIAARALLAQPVLAQIVATPLYYFPGPDNVQHRLTNHNKLFLTGYAGAIGVKTGFTDRAGVCLIAAARRNGRTMLAVVMHGTNPTQMAETLLDKGFATAPETESRVDQLPAVTTGAPQPKPKPATTTDPAAPQAKPQAKAKAKAKAKTRSLGSLPSSWPVRIAMFAFGLVGLALLATVSRRRPSRTRYAANHRPQRR
jgi:D-alanyl-D-alanine carboxypeptidase (penicillin-binding protein 5/6)